MPGSSFTPDSKALITSFDGKIWRVDVPSGEVDADSVQRQGRPQGRTEGRLRVPVGRRAGPRAADSLSAPVARRQEARVHRARAPVRHGLSRRQAAKRISTADGRRAPPGLVARRPLTSPYVTLVRRTTAGHVYRVAGRRRHAAEADTDRVVLLGPGVLARRPAHRRRPRPARGAAGGLLAARAAAARRMELVWLPAAGGEATLDHAVSAARAGPHFCEGSRAHLRVGRHAAASCRSGSTAPTARCTSRSPATSHPNAEQASRRAK